MLVVILGLCLVINLVGARLPETAFDSLWYHLTLTKLYLTNGSIFHVPGGLLYYSEMPRLIETMNIPLLRYLNIYGVHMASFAFGLGSVWILYLLSRKILDRTSMLLSLVIFYVTPLVSWLSASAYVDLQRTFFEVLAFYYLINKRYLLLGIALGLAVSTKTLSLGSLGIFLVLCLARRVSLKDVFKIYLSAFSVSLPWFVSAYLNTGYMFYPIGSGILDQTHNVGVNISNFFFDYWRLFIVSNDPISPIYVIFLPLLILTLRTFKSENEKTVLVYFFVSYLFWYVTPHTGGGRFILPYLPIWALLVGLVYSKISNSNLKLYLLVLIVLVSIINLGYRSLAVGRYWKYLVGWETESEYLCQNLPFKTGVYYDCDGFMAKNIRANDLVLVTGVHNLYYINFPYVHESWYRGERFNYVLTQGVNISPWIQTSLLGKSKLVYQNKLTDVRLWKL